MKRALCLAFALTVLLVVPALATENVIRAGIDAFHTVTDKTFATLASDPIPAGFFCPGSAPFSGQIQLRGVPIATLPAKALGNTDTIIQRLDDAVFDAQGLAHTRLQIKALSLASVQPIKTGCGLYDVTVSLAGEQPISPPFHMTIVREKPDSGYFLSEFTGNFKLTFKPVGGGPALELERSSVFRGGSDHRWSAQDQKNGRSFAGFLRIDTDGDGTPDSVVPGTSNFALASKSSPGGNSTTAAITQVDCGNHSIE